MLVLSIIAGILSLIFLYWMVEEINAYSYRKNSYEYFSTKTAGFVIIGYYFLYFGNEVYEAMSKATHGDVLNGIVLMAIGAILVSITIISNFKNTPKENRFFTILFTCIQLTIYVGLAYVSFFFILIAIAALAQTKPVYVVNNN